MKTDERTGIIYRQWQASSPRAVMLLVHGLGAHSERWKFLSEFFLQNGISSYAIELKGFGETTDLKGHIDSFNTYFKDILSLYGIIKKENPGKKVFMLGESMGALIAFLMAADNPDLFDGLICISPAFKNNLKFTPLDYVKIFTAAAYDPKKQFILPFDAAMCTQDTDYQRAMDADPREHRLATPKLLVIMAIAMMRAKMSKDKVNVPVLFLLAADDDSLVVSAAAKKVFNGLRTQDKKLIQYPDMRHALSVEKDRVRVFEEILKWLQKKV